MTTKNPVAQPDGVGEASERIWIDGPLDGSGTMKRVFHEPPPDTSANSVEYIRAPTPDSITEKAQEIVAAFNRYLVADFRDSLTQADEDSLTTIIAAEFERDSAARPEIK